MLLTGPKAPDPNNSREPTLWLHNPCLEVITVHGNELHLFWAKSFSLLVLTYIDIAAVDTTFNVFSYDAVWAEHRTHYLPNAWHKRYVLCHERGFLNAYNNNRIIFCFWLTVGHTKKKYRKSLLDKKNTHRQWEEIITDLINKLLSIFAFHSVYHTHSIWEEI